VGGSGFVPRDLLTSPAFVEVLRAQPLPVRLAGDTPASAEAGEDKDGADIQVGDDEETEVEEREEKSSPGKHKPSRKHAPQPALKPARGAGTGASAGAGAPRKLPPPPALPSPPAPPARPVLSIREQARMGRAAVMAAPLRPVPTAAPTPAGGRRGRS
jgi:hypothetical protein